jgi:hypothetical protein
MIACTVFYHEKTIMKRSTQKGRYQHRGIRQIGFCSETKLGEYQSYVSRDSCAIYLYFHCQLCHTIQAL